MASNNGFNSDQVRIRFLVSVRFLSVLFMLRQALSPKGGLVRLNLSVRCIVDGSCSVRPCPPLAGLHVPLGLARPWRV
jgi:hypothetical protein